MIGEQPAEQRADHRGHPEHRAENALISAAFAHRDALPDQGRRRHHQATGTEPLNGARTHQHRHGAGHAAQQ
ncbi:Uncharacterised protein [Mycobacteroides abscessus subsp. abscessus]|nr:Uncharacterised protein [Mycobacteroides abscessus subsp. abscessus]